MPYDAGVPFHPPLFPYFLSLLHALLGSPFSNLALRGILAALYSLQVPLLYLLARRFLKRGPALAAALLTVYSFGLSVLSISAVSEGLYLLLLLGALILFRDLIDANGPATRRPDGHGAGRKVQEERPRSTFSRRMSLRAAALGIALGGAALTRAEGLGIALVLLLWGLLRSVRGTPGRLRHAMLPWAVAGATLVLALLPWTVRNAVSLSRINRLTAAEGLQPLPTFVVTTAYGPLNFALANHESAPGHFDRGLLTSGAHSGVLDLRDPQHREYFLHGYGYGRRFITSRPEEFAKLAWRKLGYVARALRLGWTQWDLPGGLKGTRYPVDLFTPDSIAAVFLHVLFFGPGLWLLLRQPGRPRDWLSWRRDRGLLALVAVPAAVTIGTSMLFFGYARLGVLLFPFLFLVEGVTLAAAARWAGRRVPRLARGGMLSIPLGVWVLVVCLALAELAGAFQNRNYRATGETLQGSTLLNRDSIMHLEPISSR